MAVAKPRWQMGRDSFTKLWVRFTDGNERERFSLDWRSKWSRNRDKALGIQRLERLVAKYGAKAEIARLYDLETDRIIGEWRNGQRTL